MDDPDHAEGAAPNDEPTGELPPKGDADDSSGVMFRPAGAAAMPERIGPYRIRHEIGRGGMGVVYLGVRDEGHFQRRAAIKVMKRGMDTEDILHRFELERQLLAALNHPNIARVFDAGATEDGLPYFAMEFVEGLPIDEYCDRGSLGIDERLALFLQVCDAVQYAHRNLVVHRDLKPDNIIVTDEGVPKLLDFGIAKLLNPELSLVAGDPTAPELRLMTPEYASPEQILGEHITTASDVYSLGVVLYELMSGHRPYRLKERARAEIERIILEEEPERPSTAISRVEEIPAHPKTRERTGRTTRTITPESVSRMRETRPERLRRRLAGDIDNIVLMSMRKQPQRRYASVEQLAADIQRHMHGLPVTARPHSAAYRASKFVRRNKAGVAIGVMGVLVIGAAIMAGFERQRSMALEREAGLRREREQAQTEKNEALEALTARLQLQVRGLAGFVLKDLYDVVARLPGAVRIREMIVTRARSDLEALSESAPEDPDLLVELAGAYVRLGQVEGGVRNPARGDRDAASASYERARALAERALQLAPAHDGARRQLVLIQIYAGDLEYRDNPEQALAQYEAALAMAETRWHARPDDLDTRRLRGVAMLNVGKAHRGAGRFEVAEELYEQVLSIRRDLAEDAPDNDTLRRDLTVVLGYLAGVYQDTDRLDRALDMQREVVRVRREAFERRPDENRAARDLANALFQLGENLRDRWEKSGAARYRDEAAGSFQDIVDMYWKLALDSPDDARAQSDLVNALRAVYDVYPLTGDAQRALTDLRKLRRVFLARHEEDRSDHEKLWRLAECDWMLCRVATDAGEHAAAVEAGRDAVGAIRAMLDDIADEDDPDHEALDGDLAVFLTALGRAHHAAGDSAAARSAIDEALVVFQGIDPDELDLDDPYYAEPRAEATALREQLAVPGDETTESPGS